jgi:hypothetical protein
MERKRAVIAERRATRAESLCLAPLIMEGF